MFRAVVLRAVLIRVIAVGGVLLASFGMAASASAHNLLLSSSPADKSTVAVLPNEITLTFNEPALALGSVMRVTGPTGDVAQGRLSAVDRSMRQAIRPGSPGGAYTVLWRVTSLDGHPISGEFTFTATAGNGGTAPATSPGSTVAASAPSGSRPVSATSDSAGSGGSATPILVLLGVAGVLVVAAAIYLATNRPAPPPDPESLAK
jgi:methionine-rich copper-binding protein CopC